MTRSIRAVLVPWVLSRALALAIVVAVEIVSPRPGFPTLAGFANFDADWYQRIARDGYGFTTGGYSSYPFFPLLPAILKVGHVFGLPYWLTGVVVSHLAFLAGLAGFYVLVERRVGRRLALIGTVLLSVFPSALVFSTPYPSALFLAATVWAFVLVEDDRVWAASGLAVLAALLRPNGLVLAFALVVATRSLRRGAIVAGPAIVAVAVWLWTLHRWTGDALIFLNAKAAWLEVSVVDLVRGEGWKPTPLVHLLLGVAAAGVLVWASRRIPVAWIVFAGLYLGPPLLLGVVGLGRYANECFPVFFAAALAADRMGDALRRTSVAVSVVGFGVLGSAVASGRVVP